MNWLWMYCHVYVIVWTNACCCYHEPCHLNPFPWKIISLVRNKPLMLHINHELVTWPNANVLGFSLYHLIMKPWLFIVNFMLRKMWIELWNFKFKNGFFFWFSRLATDGSLSWTTELRKHVHSNLSWLELPLTSLSATTNAEYFLVVVILGYLEFCN